MLAPLLRIAVEAAVRMAAKQERWNRRAVVIGSLGPPSGRLGTFDLLSGNNSASVRRGLGPLIVGILRRVVAGITVGLRKQAAAATVALGADLMQSALPPQPKKLRGQEVSIFSVFVFRLPGVRGVSYAVFRIDPAGEICFCFGKGGICFELDRSGHAICVRPSGDRHHPCWYGNAQQSEDVLTRAADDVTASVRRRTTMIQ
jgi:hypothetical protein